MIHYTLISNNAYRKVAPPTPDVSPRDAPPSATFFNVIFSSTFSNYTRIMMHNSGVITYTTDLKDIQTISK